MRTLLFSLPHLRKKAELIKMFQFPFGHIMFIAALPFLQHPRQAGKVKMQMRICLIIFPCQPPFLKCWWEKTQRSPCCELTHAWEECIEQNLLYTSLPTKKSKSKLILTLFKASFLWLYGLVFFPIEIGDRAFMKWNLMPNTWKSFLLVPIV